MRTGHNNKEICRRVGIMLLSLVLTVSMLPVFAFAENEDAAQDAVTEADLTAESADSEQETGEAIIIADETVADETAAEGLGEGLELVRPDISLPESDELLNNYLSEQITEETGVTLDYPAADTDTSGSSQSNEEGLQLKRKSAKLAARRSVLNTDEQSAYDQIRTQIAKMASGELSRAYIAVTYSANADYELVINALMTDMPYEFYWYDKTEGYLCGTTYSGKYVFYFSVSKDYWDTSVYYSGYDLVYGLNTAKTSGTKTTIDNVNAIINKYAGNTELSKLYGYRNEICSLVSYNYDAVYASSHSGGSPFYGDPWQLIYVFDGDSSTNVVCEGYAKAFQLLCDLTGFDTIQSHMVTGGLNSTSSNHMWNIIQMDDGYNYIADLTNYDEGHGVFLNGYTSKSGDTYSYGSLSYVYDSETLQLYTSAELALSGSAYSTGNPKIHHHSEVPKTCTADGVKEYWEKDGKAGILYGDVNCTVQITSADLVIPAGHSMTDWAYDQEPTCTEDGIMERHCTVCGYKETRYIYADGHEWSDWEITTEPTYDTIGYKQRKCSDCGIVEQQIVDKLARTSIAGAAVTGIGTKTYTGKALKQTPVVKVGSVTLVSGTDYTVSYKNNKNVGKATVVISGKGKYTGTISKTFKIRPKKATIRTPAAARKAVTVKWKKQSTKMSKSRITGYQVQVATNKKFTKNKKTVTVRGYKKTSRKITGLKAKKKYYVRVRTYKTVNGKKYYSAWSKVKTVKTR